MDKQHVVIFFSVSLAAAAALGAAPLRDGAPEWANGALSYLVGGGVTYAVGGES